jgi:peptidoglycan hydrolase-like protein with peptidoglycan-binding domain
MTRTVAPLVAASLVLQLVSPLPIVSATPAAVAAQAAPQAGSLGQLPRYGERGPHVMRAQQALIAAGIPVVGGADGIFGVKTSAAIRRFQRIRGLDVTGTIDTPTASQLGLALPVQGDRGAEVARLQRALIARGITPLGGADGIFGSGTAAAIKKFQRRNDIARTGTLDAATAVALGFTPRPARATRPPATPSTTTSTAAPSTTTTTTTTAPPLTAPPTSGGATLRLGSRGPAVVRLQQALMGLDVPVTGGADGIFGPATRTALTSFQQQARLTASGVVDAASRRRLDLVLPRIGQRSPAVTHLQQRLMTAGITVRGGADGIFGSATSAAVTTYQQRNGLPATGVVNDQTAVRLDLRPAPAPLRSGATTTTTAAPSTTASSSTTTTQPAVVRIRVFPVQGLCWYADTWMAPRGGGRLHEGVDIIAAAGKLIYAVVDGTITRQYFDQPGSLSGNGIRLTAPNGTYFFYAHFSRFAPGIGIGTKVKAGQVVGYNGETGNASTPHLHFEVHPGGGAAINPTPIVRAVDACNRTAPRR